MVFDFLRKRTEEGIAQVQNIASKTIEGKLGEALSESADYVKNRQRVDLENLKRLTEGLARSRDRLLFGINSAFSDDSLGIEGRLEKLEEVLLQADIGAVTSSRIISDLRSYALREGLQVDDILPVLRSRLIEALTSKTATGSGLNSAPVVSDGGAKIPTVIFVIGANGMGKTTTIGKIASRLCNEANQTVLLGACDTFRAAAVEQLGEWAIRANVSIEKPLPEERGGSPVGVVSRSIQRAVDEGFDVVIIDTSGRLSNNFELIEELKAMKAAIQSVIPSAPHETLLVVDGSVGRNAVEQARAWTKYVGVSGIVVTKMDGTARGGFVVSVVNDIGIPVKFIGVGEKIQDLRDFDAETYVDALLGNDAVTSAKMKERVNKMLSFDDKSKDSDPSARQLSSRETLQKNMVSASLLASFNGDGDESLDGGEQKEKNKANVPTGDKLKRAKRPKPQKLVEKKAKR